MKILSGEIETIFMMNMDLIFFIRSKFGDIYKKMNYYKFTDILIFSHIFNIRQ